jgi:hypothetical protein
MAGCNRHLITNESMDLFFKEKLEEALRKNGVNATDTAQFYVWNLLLHPPEEIDRKHDKLPLATTYSHARSKGVGSWQSVADFKLVGDVCLLVSGFWWNSLARSLVDVDYFIDLGRSAYVNASRANTDLSEVLEELSDYFKEMTSVLIEMSTTVDVARTSNSELFRMYKMWMHTQNRTLGRILERVLVKQGIFPSASRGGGIN